jgi:hypothetical protein
MIDRTALRSAAVAALKAASTAAGNAVYSPQDWPTTAGGYPLIIVRTPRERKENVSPRSGPPSFFSTITLAVVGRVEDVTEGGAESALETLSAQIENALLTNGQFMYDNEVQQFAFVETSMEVNSTSERHFGETVVLFGVEVPQFYEPTIDAAGVPIAEPLTDMNIVVTSAETGQTLAVLDLPLTGA